MRKFLSLVLALVMMMSLVTINAGAKEFTDGDDITYQEAVDVISTIHVVDGYADGDFKPGNNLTRGAAAKIICNLILGPTTAAELHADTAPYRDVPVTNDFAGYIAYCQKEGIISGYADGSFRPAGTLTGYAFMKMLLGALGYDAEIEGYTGPNWSINVAKRAIGIGLNNSLEKTFNGVEYVTREEAALYAFNTLRADLVEYSQKITATVNGAEVTVGNSNAAPQEWGSQMTRRNNIYEDAYVQFAEQYFNKLVLTQAMDCFGRPDREWKYDGDEIGAYINMDLFKQEYTTEVTGKDLRDLLGGTVIDEYDFEIHVDGLDTVADKDDLDDNDNKDVFSFAQGNMIRTNTKGIGGTGNGVLTQVFVDNDHDDPTVWIAVINTYLAKATDDYNEKKEEVEFEVYSLEDVDDTGSIVLVKNTNDYKNDADKAWTTDLTVKNEDITVEDVKDGDIVLVRVADGEIKEILDPEVISDTEISAFKNGKWVKADEQYDYANSTTYDPEVLDQYVDDNMKDTTYNLYLDPYGYLIGIEIVEATTNYLFLTGIDGKTSNLANKTAEGNVILLDGTMDTVTIKLKDSRYENGDDMTESVAHPLNSLMNTWCKYTTNKNGDYVLTEIARTQPYFDAAKNKTGQSHVFDITESHVDDDFDYNTIDKKHVSTLGIPGSNVKMAYGTDDSVYLTVTTGLITATRVSATIDETDSAFIIDDVDSVTVGVQNANLRAFTAYEIWRDAGATGRGGIANTTGGNGTEKQLDSIANGVYNLFDTDGAIIAAVVVGEDSGSTTNYAYTISDNVKQETWNKEDEEWTWTREVVINGEVVDVTEVTDGKNPEIRDMVRGQWYEMKYKGDGTVKSATLIGWDENRNDAVDSVAGRPDVVGEFVADADYDHGASKFVGLVRKVESAVEDEDTVVLSTDLTGRGLVVSTSDYPGTVTKDNVSIPTVGNNYSPINPTSTNVTEGTNIITAQGNTLWIENKVANQKDGFAVRNDAKVVLVQDTHVIRNGVVTKVNVMENVYTYSQTGKEALSKMVKDLMDNENFSGFISAVFDGGVATSVVVWDQTPEDINTGDDPQQPEGPKNTINVNLQFKDVADDSDINIGARFENVKAGDKLTFQPVYDYVCISHPTLTYVVPAFGENQTEMTDVIWFGSAGGATIGNDKGTPDLASIVVDAGKKIEGNGAAGGANPALPADGTYKDKDSGETFVGADLQTAIKDEIKALTPGMYHYPQSLRDLVGWNRSDPNLLQISESEPTWEAMILVTGVLASDGSAEYQLFIDEEAQFADDDLWAGDDAAHYALIDGLAEGMHTYYLVNVGTGAIILYGTFEIVKP